MVLFHASHEGPTTGYHYSMRRYVAASSGWLAAPFVVSAVHLARCVSRFAGLALVALALGFYILTVLGGLLGMRHPTINLLASVLGSVALIFGLVIVRQNTSNR